MNPMKKALSPLLAFVTAAVLSACGAGRSQLVSYEGSATGGFALNTGGSYPMGGSLGKTGGAVGNGGQPATGGYPQRTGGRPRTGGFGAGGQIPTTGGFSIATGGTLVRTGGIVVRTGGGVIRTGGIVIRTGGGVIRTGGGMIRTGGAVPGSGGFVMGSGGMVVQTGGTTVPPDAGVCGPVCDIYCPYGNQLDALGCRLCACNPPPDALPPVDTNTCPDLCIGLVCPYGFIPDETGCPTCRCKEGPNGCPPVMCKPCPFGIMQDEKGCYTCECIPDPAIPCNRFTYSNSCNASPRGCQWLSPGCDTPALTTSGCFDPTQLDCDGTCPDELTCLKRSVNPCANGDCAECGEFRAVCL